MDLDAFTLFERHINPGLAGLLRFTGLDRVESHAEGPYVWDTQGKRYLDFLGLYGTLNLGHGNPEVVEAVKRQAETLMAMPQTLPTPMRGEFYRTLTAILPPELNRVFPVNSGTEANEAALKFARAHTGRKKFVAAMRGFSGRTMGNLSNTWKTKYREPFLP